MLSVGKIPEHLNEQWSGSGESSFDKALQAEARRAGLERRVESWSNAFWAAVVPAIAIAAVPLEPVRYAMAAVVLAFASMLYLRLRVQLADARSEAKKLEREFSTQHPIMVLERLEDEDESEDAGEDGAVEATDPVKVE